LLVAFLLGMISPYLNATCAVGEVNERQKKTVDSRQMESVIIDAVSKALVTVTF